MDFERANKLVSRKPSSRLARRRLIVLLTLLLCSLSPFILVCSAAAQGRGTFEDGRRAYDFGEYATAQRIWIALAQTGDIRSQASLGYLYREGKGVLRDSKEAAHWYYQAALRGDPTAQSALCDMHLKGEGVSRDLKAAFFWCELSIEGGETSGIALRERALNRISTEQRDEVWTMISQWRALQTHEPCCDLAAEPHDASSEVCENSVSSAGKPFDQQGDCDVLPAARPLPSPALAPNQPLPQ